MPNDDDCVGMTYKLHHETEKAYLFSDDGEEENAKWVAKSLVVEMIDKGKDHYEVTLPIWLAMKNGWV